MKEVDFVDIREYDIKALAYIGDVVYEKYIREHLVRDSTQQVNKLHKKAIKYVSAKAQSAIFSIIQKEITEEENNIFKRGRNADANTVPKNTDVVTYKIATGFESLLGYLYMGNNNDRLEYLINKSIEIVERDL